MKPTIVFLFSVLLFTAFTFVGCSGGNDQHEAAESAAPSYTCPMHPSVVSDRPGACPVCGMSLVRASTQSEFDAAERTSIEHVSLSPTQRVLANVSVQPARKGSVIRTLSLVGVVDVAEPLEATVAARFRGRIERVHAAVTGERVSAGTPLFDLYSPDLVTAIQEFIVALQAPPRQAGSGQEIVTGVRSRLRLHFGLTRNQVAEIESTRTLRTTATFVSPISGTVLAKSVREGDYVDEGTIVYRLADLSKVWIHLDVYESDLRHLRIGQTVVIATEAYPGEAFSGRITFIDPVMDLATRTSRVRTEFSNTHGRLKPNMYVTARLEVREDDRLLVPRQAVLETGRRSVVWVETSENTFEPRTVVTGMRGDDMVAIHSGLQQGDRVAVTGGFLIDSESALQQPPGMTEHVHDAAARRADKPAGAVPGPDNVVHITVKGSYAPDVVRVKKGEEVRLRFYRAERSRCTEVVKFDELNIRRELPAFDTTEVRIRPTKEGTVHFSCGMDMVHGTLIVE